MDGEQLGEETDERLSRWREWLAQTDALAAAILSRRGGKPIPVDDLLKADRAELEARGQVSDENET